MVHPGIFGSEPPVGVSVTLVPGRNVHLHTCPLFRQLTPLGDDVTNATPEVLGSCTTMFRATPFDLLKLAVTERFAFTLVVHVGAVPVHAPPQPVKLLPGAALAVSVTEVKPG